MSFTRSRLMSLATAAYGVYALKEPRHLGRAVTSDPAGQASYDLLARTYGARDLAVSALGLLGPGSVVTAAMLVRSALDLSDAGLLTPRADSTVARAKVLGVTTGWATLNLLALRGDRRALEAKRLRD
ncbi:MAG: hypothetical protein ACXVWW_08655 [Nocardioides sp.]